jgi:hypothetical protein
MRRDVGIGGFNLQREICLGVLIDVLGVGERGEL